MQNSLGLTYILAAEIQPTPHSHCKIKGVVIFVFVYLGRRAIYNKVLAFPQEILCFLLASKASITLCYTQDKGRKPKFFYYLLLLSPTSSLISIFLSKTDISHGMETCRFLPKPCYSLVYKFNHTDSSSGSSFPVFQPGRCQLILPVHGGPWDISTLPSHKPFLGYLLPLHHLAFSF